MNRNRPCPSSAPLLQRLGPNPPQSIRSPTSRFENVNETFDNGGQTRRV
jgi:hypothetical protein